MSKANSDEFVTFLFNWAQKQGGFQSALDFMNANKVPRKYRRAAKLIKKVFARVDQGEKRKAGTAHSRKIFCSQVKTHISLKRQT